MVNYLMVNGQLSYDIEPEIEILSASLVFAILISYRGVRNSFRHVSVLRASREALR